MAIKIFVSVFALFVSTIILSEEKSIPKCIDLGVEIQSTFVDYQYDKKGINLVSKDLVMGPLEPEWSNQTREFKEVFYKYEKANLHADSVNITYFRKLDKKLLSNKTFKLEKSSDGLLKVKGFLFNEGVQKAKDRPGVQTYTFQSKGKPVCQQIVKHFYSSESE